jgi:hypothetical protein
MYPLSRPLDYEQFIEQIRSAKDPASKRDLLKFIGDKGDDRFIQPLIDYLALEDNPVTRSDLYATFTRIGTSLASQSIEEQIKNQPPKDNGEKISSESWSEAIQFLADSFEPDFIERLQQLIESKGPLWGSQIRGGVGIYVRNLLRNNGFDWGDKALQSYWSWLAEEAVKLRKEEAQEE